MLSPKRTKYRKPHRGRLKGQAMRGNKISFGDLVSCGPLPVNGRFRLRQNYFICLMPLPLRPVRQTY